MLWFQILKYNDQTFDCDGKVMFNWKKHEKKTSKNFQIAVPWTPQKPAWWPRWEAYSLMIETNPCMFQKWLLNIIRSIYCITAGRKTNSHLTNQRCNEIHKSIWVWSLFFQHLSTALWQFLWFMEVIFLPYLFM